MTPPPLIIHYFVIASTNYSALQSFRVELSLLETKINVASLTILFCARLQLVWFTMYGCKLFSFHRPRWCFSVLGCVLLSRVITIGLANLYLFLIGGLVWPD
eukprot:TRINITY_DN41689_c0_g1_i1.p1 TRINITY_DN41689_c0_g1~~TRINITY_DN41689_c0_g1_i1.p1  ORF type:complete len:102 (+),score=10.56 TRINITY_DN41689_c0_g1_i1:202-507(+)